ncbi:MAG: hypothetical protein HY553_04600, partial [Elusimicrobia bacterium]|nr:hypothetical protein [Elusimicrobiota bacterium]
SGAFVADATYGAGAHALNVVVAQRPTSLVADAATAYVNDVFTATATLRDDRRSFQGMSGRPVTFYFDQTGASQTVTTVASPLGQGTTIFAVAASSGLYRYNVTFAATPAYGGSSTGAIAVTVLQRPTIVQSEAVNVTAGAPFVAAATVRDVRKGNTPIQGETVYFVYGSSTNSGVTGADGRTTVQFVSVPGTAQYSATHPSVVKYAFSSATGTVTVSPRVTLVAAQSTSAWVTTSFSPEVFTASATVLDTYPSPDIPIAGATVTFTFRSVNVTAWTDANGVALATFTASAPAGPAVAYTASFSDAYGFYQAHSDNAKTVNIQQRPASVAATPFSSAAPFYADELLVATATLRDSRTNALVAGSSIAFTYASTFTQTGSAYTTSAGTATRSFWVGITSGAFTVTALLQPTSVYASDSDAVTVYVTSRPTTVLLSTPSAAVYAEEYFQVGAALTDDRKGGAAIGSKQITFAYQGLGQPGTTSGLGVATTAYFAGVSSGPHAVSGSFLADATYGAGAHALNVVVAQRPTSLVASAASTYANHVFTATATLRDDRRSFAGMAGRQVTFYLDQTSASQTATTAASPLGQATTVFAVGPSSGTYRYNVTFAPDAAYAGGSSATIAVRVDPRPTAIQVAAVPAVYAGKSFIATATLRDLLTGDVVAGQTIHLSYLTSNATAVTNEVGVATASFPAGGANGAYVYVASTTENATYAASSSSTYVNVIRRGTSILAVDRSTFSLGSFAAQGTLMDDVDGVGVAAKTLRFVYREYPQQTAATDDGAPDPLGQGTTVFQAGPSSGTYVYDIHFDGDPAYSASSGQATVTISSRPTVLEAVPVQSVFASIGGDKTFVATATVRDYLSGATVSSQVVYFSYRGANASATGSGSGVATATFVSGASTGTFVYVASIAANATYGTASTGTFVNVEPRVTDLSFSGTPSPYATDNFNASVTLTDVFAQPVSGGLVHFQFRGQTEQVATNASGVAGVTFGAGVSSGPFDLSATFLASELYVRAASTITPTVRPRPTLVEPLSATVFALEVFTATATLRDGITWAGLSGETVSFLYRETPQSTMTKTSPLGEATTRYFALASSGTYHYRATFDPTPTYAGDSSTNTARVDPRPTEVLAVAVSSAVVGETFVATATLRDLRLNAWLAGQSLRFNFGAQELFADTDEVGQATVTFNTGASSGTLSYAVTFASAATYAGESDVKSVVAYPRRTTLVADDVAGSVYTEENFIATATLRDFATNATISTKTIRITFHGADSFPKANDVGVATAAIGAGYTANPTDNFSARWEGDSEYGPSEDLTNLVSVAARPTLLSADPVAEVYAEEFFTATATLRDQLRNPEARPDGLTVSFVYQGAMQVPQSSWTHSGLGIAATHYFAGASSGTWNYTAAFTGTDRYGAQSDTNNTVLVRQRPTSLGVPNVPFVYANSVFLATATLRDTRRGGLPVKNRRVDFSYPGQSASWADTDASGEAVVAFNSGISSGNVRLNAQFSADATYEGTPVASATVAVSWRPIRVQLAAPSQIRTGLLFIASATVTDALDTEAPYDAVPVGWRVNFILNGAPQAAYTDSSGLATFVFTSPSSSGTYSVTANVPSSAPYQTSFASQTLTVDPRPTDLTATDGDTKTLALFLATATVIDLETGLAPASAVSVSFIFEGATQTVLTDGAGVATTGFYAPGASGSYFYTARLSSTPFYVGDEDTGLITTTERPTTMTGAPVTVLAMDTFVASGTLTDTGFGTAIDAKDVTFWFEGSSATKQTSAMGSATTSYAAPDTSGTYRFNLTFPGDPTYMPVSTQVAVAVQARPTTLAPVPASAYAYRVFLASAILADANDPGKLVAGRAVRFSLQGNPDTDGATDAVGLATASFTAPLTSGTYTLGAQFAGDGTYLARSSDTTLAVLPRPTVLAADSVVVAALDRFSIAATLRESVDSGLVDGKPVFFHFNGATQTFTASLGAAATEFAAPAVAGSYFATIWTEDDATFRASTITLAVGVTKRPTLMTAAPSFSALGDSVFSASATLKDFALNAPLAGATVQFQWYDAPPEGEPKLNEGITSASGLAGATFYAPGLSGLYEYVATYAGNETYAVSRDTGFVRVGQLSRIQTGTEVDAIVLRPFTLSAQLVKATDGTPLNGLALNFYFNGATHTVTTSGLGNATTGFLAPASTQPISALIRFDGDAQFAFSYAFVAVNVRLRPTSIAAFDGGGYVDNQFATRAKLFDTVDQAGIAGATVTFTFNAVSTTAVTDGSGVATTKFTAGSSSGSVQFSANYPGAGLYEGSIDTGTIALELIPTNLFLFDAVVAASNSFTAQGRLLNLLNGKGLAGHNISIQVFGPQGLTKTVQTGSLGDATTGFIAPSSSGTYVMQASFIGTTIYAPVSANATLAVDRRLSLLAVTSVRVAANEVFTATATLKDRETQVPLPGLPVDLSFRGSTRTLTTDGSGIVSATFSAPGSVEEAVLRAEFFTDATYAATVATAAAFIEARPTLVAIGAAPPLTGVPFVATVTVTDALSNVRLANVPVNIRFGNSVRNKLTELEGEVAAADFTAPTSSGTYSIVATFAPYGLNGFASSTATISVLQRPTALSLQNAQVLLRDVWVASATVRDTVDNAAVPGLPVLFTFGGSTASAVTSEVGLATAAFPAAVTAGTYTFTAAYGGGSEFGASLNVAELSALRRPLRLDAAAMSTYATRLFTSTAVAVDVSSGSNVADLGVEFEYAGATRPATTDSLGRATMTFTAGASTGTDSVVVTFFGDSVYLPAQSTGTLSVLSLPTVLIPLDVDAFVDQVFFASGTLTQEGGGGLEGLAVSYVFEGSTKTVSTDALGSASTTFLAPSSSGTYALSARFAGTALYAPNERESQVRVGVRPTEIVADDVIA